MVNRTRRRRRAQGFFTTDALVGLLIVAALAAALAVGAGQHRRATTRLADAREALHVAERALVALQCGKPVPPDADDARVVVQTLPDVAPAGQRWVDVSVTVRERSSSLVGLAPVEAPR